MTVNTNQILIRKKMPFMGNMNNYLILNKNRNKNLILINNIQKYIDTIYETKIIFVKKQKEIYNFNKMFKNFFLKNKKDKKLYTLLKKKKKIKYNKKSMLNSCIKNYLWIIWKSKNNSFPLFWNIKNNYLLEKKMNTIQNLFLFKNKYKKIDVFFLKKTNDKRLKKIRKKTNKAKKTIKIIFLNKKKNFLFFIYQKLKLFIKTIIFLKKKKN